MTLLNACKKEKRKYHVAVSLAQTIFQTTSIDVNEVIHITCILFALFWWFPACFDACPAEQLETHHHHHHPQLSDDVELAHRRPLLAAALVEPLAVCSDVEEGAVLSAAAVRLLGDISLPVREAHAAARLIHPPALGDHVVDTQPDVHRRADALPDIVQQLLVVVGRGGCDQAAALGRAVVAGGVEAPLDAVGQETLARDLGASQTHWEVEKSRWSFTVRIGLQKV